MSLLLSYFGNMWVQVGNYTTEKMYWGRPENITSRRPVYYVTTHNGTSDLVGQVRPL